MQPQVITLTSICNGAVPEVFERELNEIFQNIQDVNTDPQKSRKLTLEFTFKPLSDRSGAEASFICKRSLVPVTAVKASVFFSRQNGELKAYGYDLKQGQLFTGEGEPALADTKVVSINK